MAVSYCTMAEVNTWYQVFVMHQHNNSQGITSGKAYKVWRLYLNWLKEDKTTMHYLKEHTMKERRTCSFKSKRGKYSTKLTIHAVFLNKAYCTIMIGILHNYPHIKLRAICKSNTARQHAVCAVALSARPYKVQQALQAVIGGCIRLSTNKYQLNKY